MSKTNLPKQFIEQVETIDPDDVHRIAKALGASAVSKVATIPNHLGGGVHLRPDHIREDLDRLPANTKKS
jgi:hypothetical protein